MAAAPLVEDDTTYNDGGTVDDTYASTQYTSSTPAGIGKKQNPILTKLFMTCENDAMGSVHRAWAVTVLFMVIFFIVAIIEGEFCIYNYVYVFCCVIERVVVIGITCILSCC